MRTQIERSGDQLILKIPADLAAEAGIEDGSEVEFSLVSSRLVIASVQPRYTLDALLAGITDDNRHGETDTGSPVGREVC